MIQKIKHMVVALAVVLGGVAVLAPSATVGALNPSNKVLDGVNASGGDTTTKTDLNDNLEQIINVLLFLIGAIAVIMIVVGGIRYTLSAGDQNAAKAAKDTILYAVIGLVVAILAYAIVKWVVGAFN